MKIVLIEDNEDHREIISELLIGNYSFATELACFDTLHKGFEYINNHKVDLVLCDLNLPDSECAETVLHLKALHEAPAIIVLTSMEDESLAQQLIKAGIQDYLPKSELSRAHLVRACNYAVERKNLNESLIKKNDDYKAFCYSLTHDFKNNLWQIIKFTDRFIKETEGKLEKYEDLPINHLLTVTQKASNISQIVQDLHDYLSIDVSQQAFTKINLNLLIEHAIEQCFDTETVEKIDFEVGALPEIYGNNAQLTLALGNLISNAVKYNEASRPNVYISTGEDNRDFHSIIIRDNGIGIAAEDLDKIFSPFERGQHQNFAAGSGLGLSIVKQIIQRHFGRIQAQSALGQGTQFTLFIPKKLPH